jgi:hypothetical protein
MYPIVPLDPFMTLPSSIYPTVFRDASINRCPCANAAIDSSKKNNSVRFIDHPLSGDLQVNPFVPYVKKVRKASSCLQQKP